MQTAETVSVSAGRRLALGGFLLPATLAVWLLAGSTASAQSAGQFISVPSPITSERVKRIRTFIEQAVSQFADAEEKRGNERRKFRLIFDFNPDGKPHHSSAGDFGVCFELADMIYKFRTEGVPYHKPGGPQSITVITTAFVHGEAKLEKDEHDNAKRVFYGQVTGHSVLPVLACGEIILSEHARLGPVLDARAKPLTEDRRLAYLRLGGHHGELYVRKFFDKNLVIRPVKDNVDPETKDLRFVAGSDPAADPDKPALFDAGSYAVYDLPKASVTNLTRTRALEDREAVKTAFQLPRSSLEHPLLKDRLVVWKIPVEGAVTRKLQEKLQRRISRATSGKSKANLIVLDLRCAGGDPAVAYDIAMMLKDEREKERDDPLALIAYVSPEARDTAIYLALACNFFVMNSDANLGGFDDLLRGEPAEKIQEIANALEKLAEDRSYPASLVRGFVDPTEKIVSARRSQGGPPVVMTDRQFQEKRQKEPGDWSPTTDVIKPANAFLTLNAARAYEYGLVESKASDLPSLYTSLGVKESDVRTSGPDWLDRVADFLGQWWTGCMLVMIGFTCLILELKMPGVSLPGVIAALCFLLFFWSQSQLHGQFLWLAVLLFLLGLVLLGVEIFILPGFGVCGISGILLIIVSLALAVQGRWPQESSDWTNLMKNVAPFGLTLLGAGVSALLLGKYLPNIPFANRLILKPQTETSEGGEEPIDPAQAALVSLLGAIGVAATPLRPAGKVQFGEQFIDVVAEGSYVQPGARVQVIEIEGYRVVVKEV